MIFSIKLKFQDYNFQLPYDKFLSKVLIYLDELAGQEIIFCTDEWIVQS